MSFEVGKEIVLDSQSPPDNMIEGDGDEKAYCSAMLDQHSFVKGSIWVIMSQGIQLVLLKCLTLNHQYQMFTLIQLTNQILFTFQKVLFEKPFDFPLRLNWSRHCRIVIFMTMSCLIFKIIFNCQLKFQYKIPKKHFFLLSLFSF